ncbi:hypothetical protein PR048_002657 [Dryococelus australis]|uniref:Fibronectin type-III domain-containing protein n=1 Tax=Dryococelus australis TaxID=614101 RepID=A0ABQ9IKX4_9NEOP|nr:hypothetical protein PR048_002657 [Dryococelus australis]
MQRKLQGDGRSGIGVDYKPQAVNVMLVNFVMIGFRRRATQGRSYKPSETIHPKFLNPDSPTWTFRTRLQCVVFVVQNESQQLVVGPAAAHGDWRDVIVPVVPSEQLTQRVSYLIKGLEPVTQYEAKVQARNRFGWGRESDGFQFLTRSAGQWHLTAPVTPPPPISLPPPTFFKTLLVETCKIRVIISRQTRLQTLVLLYCVSNWTTACLDTPWTVLDQ